MTPTAPTTAQALTQLAADVDEIKVFIVRLEPIVEQVHKNTECLHANGQGVMMRLRSVEEWQKREMESVVRKLGYKALEIVMSGFIMAIVAWILMGSLLAK